MFTVAGWLRPDAPLHYVVYDENTTERWRSDVNSSVEYMRLIGYKPKPSESYAAFIGD